jgi:hypothetical protein
VAKRTKLPINKRRGPKRRANDHAAEATALRHWSQAIGTQGITIARNTPSPRRSYLGGKKTARAGDSHRQSPSSATRPLPDFRRWRSSGLESSEFRPLRRVIFGLGGNLVTSAWRGHERAMTKPLPGREAEKWTRLSRELDETEELIAELRARCEARRGA